jgi:ABC-type glutathione transport system ATPase component
MLILVVKLFSVDPPHSSPHLPIRFIKSCKCISLLGSYFQVSYSRRARRALSNLTNASTCCAGQCELYVGNGARRKEGESQGWGKVGRKKTNDGVRKKSKKTKSQNLLPSTIDESKITDSAEKEEEPPFNFSDLRFEVPKGAFVAIVGRVGCGKVSREVTVRDLNSLIYVELFTSSSDWGDAAYQRRGMDLA